MKQRWRDLELYVADSFKVTPRVTADFGLRVSHLEPPWMADDQQANFVLDAVDPALGNSPCNGMEYPPGANPCRGLGLEGGRGAPTRSLVPVKFLWFAPRLGVAWDVFGDGNTAIRGGVGLFYERERVSTELGLGLNPPISGTAAVTRRLDSNAPVVGEVAPEYGAPGAALDTTAGNAHYWQWNVTLEHEVFRNTLVELAYVGSRGLGLLGQTNLNEVPPENRLAYARTGDAALRPLDGITGIGNGDIALSQHDRNSIYHGLQVALNSRFGRGSAGCCRCRAKSRRSCPAARSRSPWTRCTRARAPPGDRRRQDRLGVDLAQVNASLVLALPTLQDKSSFVRNVLGDWEFATIVQAGSGYPVSVGAWVPGLNGLGAPAMPSCRHRTGS